MTALARCAAHAAWRDFLAPYLPDGYYVVALIFAGMATASGLLIVNSGQGMFGQAPGNAMIAFKPKEG